MIGRQTINSTCTQLFQSIVWTFCHIVKVVVDPVSWVMRAREKKKCVAFHRCCFGWNRYREIWTNVDEPTHTVWQSMLHWSADHISGNSFISRSFGISWMSAKIMIEGKLPKSSTDCVGYYGWVTLWLEYRRQKRKTLRSNEPLILSSHSFVINLTKDRKIDTDNDSMKKVDPFEHRQIIWISQ